MCCALPILLVSLGLGAAVAGMISAAPWVVTLSQHKAWLFMGTAVLLVFSAWLIYRPGRACPTEPELARSCATADRWNRRVWWFALSIWVLGAFMAYLWLPLQRLFDF